MINFFVGTGIAIVIALVVYVVCYMIASWDEMPWNDTWRKHEKAEKKDARALGFKDQDDPGYRDYKQALIELEIGPRIELKDREHLLLYQDGSYEIVPAEAGIRYGVTSVGGGGGNGGFISGNGGMIPKTERPKNGICLGSCRISTGNRVSGQEC